MWSGEEGGGWRGVGLLSRHYSVPYEGGGGLGVRALTRSLHARRAALAWRVVSWREGGGRDERRRLASPRHPAKRPLT